MLVSLLCELSDTTQDDARQTVADVVFNESDVVLPASMAVIKRNGGGEFDIHVSAIKSHASHATKANVDTLRLQVNAWQSHSVTPEKLDVVDDAVEAVGAGTDGEETR